MSKINELRAQRAKTWEQTKAFLDSHRSDKGVLSVEDTATYEKMEQEIVDLGREIERQERLDAFERELNTPVNTPITQKPDTANVDTKTGRASDTYKKAFWAQARTKGGMLTAEIRNALQEGVDSEGGYLVPDEFEQTLVQSLEAENVVRSLAHVITTASGSHKIPIVATKGTAAWVDEEGTIPEGDDAFGQQLIGAHKVATMIKVSEELLNDAAFDLEAYFRTEFSRRIGHGYFQCHGRRSAWCHGGFRNCHHCRRADRPVLLSEQRLSQECRVASERLHHEEHPQAEGLQRTVSVAARSA